MFQESNLAFFLRPQKPQLVHNWCTRRAREEPDGVQKTAEVPEKRLGRVSYFFHHGSWWVYYLEGQQQVRRRIGEDEKLAEQIAAQVNAQLITAAPTMFAFTPVAVGELCQRFLEHHEQVLRSSLATVNRYRTALKHLEDFVARIGGEIQVHEVPADRFVRYLRSARIAPNGHPHTAKRQLRDKGVRYILEVCRSLYGYAVKNRHLPPYTDNPFVGLGGKRLKIEDAKPIFVFNADAELAFLNSADAWAFPIQFTLAKTGVRPGELIHLLVEDLDLDGGWLHVHNKSELGWQVKTRRERSIPLVDELVAVLRLRHWPADCRPGVPATAVRPEKQPAGPCRPSRVGEGRRTAYRKGGAGSGRTALARRPGEDRPDRLAQRRALRADRIRLSFIHIAQASGLANATCPKSWRHSFANSSGRWPRPLA